MIGFFLNHVAYYLKSIKSWDILQVIIPSTQGEFLFGGATVVRAFFLSVWLSSYNPVIFFKVYKPFGTI